MTKTKAEYKKFWCAHLPIRDPRSPDIALSFKFGLLELYFDAPAVEVLEEVKRTIEEAIEFAKQNPW
jgi:hypothetical protein